MKNIISILFLSALLSACGSSKSYYTGAPATPADIPPPTDLLQAPMAQ